jgi:hypothetical protein
MPLRLRCPNCRRQLLLDKAFAGGNCRCRHCRTLIEVPLMPRRKGSGAKVRPERPPLADPENNSPS